MRSVLTTLLLLSASSIPSPTLRAQEPAPAVHAIFFYHPTCPHCHDVINEHLVPMQERYGDRLVILGFDTSQKFAQNLFSSTLQHFTVPRDRWVVPFMVVGDEVLIGGLEIPSSFPSIVEEGLASGGIDFPDIPELVQFLQEQGLLDPNYPDRRVAPQSSSPEEDVAVADTAVVEAEDTVAVEPVDTPALMDTVTRPSVDTVTRPPVDTASPSPADTAVLEPTEALVDTGDLERRPDSPAVDTVPVARADTPGVVPTPERPTPQPGGAVGLAEAMRELEAMTWRDHFLLDTAGNSLSVLVLLGMLVSLVITGYPPRVKREEWAGWVVPALVVVGAVVAAYLSFVEVTETEAVCGPVGDCNTVQQSEYAVLFGILPVGVMGLVGYGVVLALWAVRRAGSGAVRAWAGLGLWAAALLGTLFSVYLTFLEPFVIGASCIWCLASAVIMTLLLWATAPMAARAWPGDASRPGIR